MRRLSTYLHLKNDVEHRAWQASQFLLAVHPFTDGNGRTARELYRRLTGKEAPKAVLRPILTELMRRATKAAHDRSHDGETGNA